MLFKTKKINKILLAAIMVSICFAVFFYFGTNTTLAQYGEEIVGGINVPQAELIMSIIKVINYVLGFLALIAIILVLYAGYLWMTAGGNADQVDKAKKILINALIGLIIIILSFAIVTYIFNILEGKIDPGPGQPCEPRSSCVACNLYCNKDGVTEYDSITCGGEEWCGALPAPEIFKINSILTSCGNPPEYNKDVHLCSSVMINFNHHLDLASIESSVNDNSLRVQDCSTDSACDNPVDLSQTYAGSQPTGIGNEWVALKKSASFVHQDLFESNNYYRLIIPKTLKDKTGAEIDPNDGCGAGLNPIAGCLDAGTEYRWTFQTGTTLDDTPPVISSTYPINQESAVYPERNVNLRPVLWAKFSEAIAPWSVNKDNIKIRQIIDVDPADPDNSGTPGDFINDYSIEVNSQGRGIEIYNLILEAFAWYEIDVSNIVDLCNNPMAAAKKWRFQTNDIGPGVKKIYPSNGYQKACPDTNVFIVFNTSMYNPETGSCQVVQGGIGGGYVIEGKFLPSLTGKFLQVVDDYPGLPDDPNNYCQKYKFMPSDVQLATETDYSVGVNTDLVIDQQSTKLNYGDVPPANFPSQGDWHFKVKPYDECEKEPGDDDEYLKIIKDSRCIIDENDEIKAYPSPNPYLNSSQVCLNSLISARFDRKIVSASLDVAVELCIGPTINPCQGQENRQAIDGTLTVLDFNDLLSMFQFRPAQNLKAGEFYIVTINDVQGTDDSQLENAFSWIFETYYNESQGICPVQNVSVTPRWSYQNQVGATEIFTATPMGKECTELIEDDLTWQWASSKTEVAVVSGSTTNQETAKVIGEGMTYISASLPEDINGKARMIVRLEQEPEYCDSEPEMAMCQPSQSLCTQPDYPVCEPESCLCIKEIEPISDVYILNFSPTGAQSCTNLIASLLFDQPMNQASLTASTNISLWKPGLPASKLDNKNIFKLTLDKIKNIIKKVFAQPAWIEVLTNLNFSFIKQGEQGCLHKDGCTQVRIYPKNILEKGVEYKVFVAGSSAGVKSKQGGLMQEDKSWLFNILAEAEICLIDKIEIQPASHTFTQINQQRDFAALAKSKGGQEITNVPGAYEWAWHWDKIDNDKIIKITGSTSDTETVTANNLNGQATLMVTSLTTLDIIGQTEGKRHTGYAQITNALCLNPWPANGQPYLDTNGYANFSLFYCRDKGADLKMCQGGENPGADCTIGGDECGSGICVDVDDLPALQSPNPIIYDPPSGDILEEYLLLRDDDSTDAIGIRIFDNLQHLSPQAWYEAKEFTGSPSSLEVDNYQAIQDGRSIYVSAATLSDSSLYTNIYLISYNENASQETIDIYNRLLNNWKFNINMHDYRICSGGLSFCTRDDECPENETCNADKSKLTRDTKRVTDLGALKKYLEDYKTQNGYYPKLEAGSYVQGYSTSKWPSWTQTLGPALAKSLPVDPINEFNNCPVDYDQESCWNEITKDFVCPDGSHVYQYQTTGGTNFYLYGNMEYSGTGYWGTGSDSCTDYSISP